jgi:hypothetical protein
MDFLEGVFNPPPTYDKMCQEFQDVLVFVTYGNNMRFRLHNPLTSKWGFTHLMTLNGSDAANPLAAAMGRAPKSGPKKFYRFGTYYVDKDDFGGGFSRWYCTAAINGVFRTSLEQQWSPRVKTWCKAQVSSTERIGAGSMTYRGTDFTAQVRATTEPFMYFAYSQRLSSNLNFGGEMSFSQRAFNTLYDRATPLPAAAMAQAKAPLALTAGITYKMDETWKLLLQGEQQSMARTLVRAAVKHDVTDNTTLAASLVADVRSGLSMASIAYRIRMPRTKSTMRGSLDTYGNVKALYERTLLSTAKLGLTANCNFLSNKQSKFGMELQLGYSPRPERSESPLLFERTIFNV